MAVTREDVTNAYRWLLGREPDEHGLTAWLGAKSREELRRGFVTSPEFRDAVLQLPPLPTDQTLERVPRLLPRNDVEWLADAAMEARLVAHIQETWRKLGDDRPHWSVLSADRFLPESIESHRDEFYASGLSDVALIANVLDSNRIDINGVRSVVEYGCGVGRVTPYLADNFPIVTAIDISASHLAMAHAQCAGRRGVKFQLAQLPGFGMAEPFDLWFSYIVLQHNPPPVIARILARAFELLAPSGVAIFQVPTWSNGYRFCLTDYLESRPAEPTIEVHCLPQRVIFDLARRAGCVPVAVREDMAMKPPGWSSHLFVFRKPPPA